MNKVSKTIEIKNKDIYLSYLGNLFEIIFHINRDCPWTKSLNLIDLLDLLYKEIDEVSYALEKKDSTNLEEEIGDVLFNIFLIPFIIINCNMNISFCNSINLVISKMIKRHTWVNFPGKKAIQKVETISDVDKLWNQNHDKIHGKVNRLRRDKILLIDKINKLEFKRNEVSKKIDSSKIRLYQIKESLKEIELRKKVIGFSVYCSDNSPENSYYKNEILKLIKFFISSKITCISSGVYSENSSLEFFNKTVKQNGGSMINVKKKSKEVNQYCTEEILSDSNDLNEINRILKKISNNFIFFPGDFKVISSLWDVISDQTSKIDRNIIVININGFFNGTKRQIYDLTRKGVINQKVTIRFLDSVDKITKIKN
jgi:XTP/dITP diphosphohydrolase